MLINHALSERLGNECRSFRHIAELGPNMTRSYYNLDERPMFVYMTSQPKPVDTSWHVNIGE